MSYVQLLECLCVVQRFDLRSIPDAHSTENVVILPGIPGVLIEQYTYMRKNWRGSRALFFLGRLRQAKVVDGNPCGMHNKFINI